MSMQTSTLQAGPRSAIDAVRDYLKNGEVALAIGILAILIVLLIPLPAWLLDVSLSFSITFAILILMTSIFIRKPLEFSSFPTVLLISTMRHVVSSPARSIESSSGLTSSAKARFNLGTQRLQKKRGASKQ